MATVRKIDFHPGGLFTSLRAGSNNPRIQKEAEEKHCANGTVLGSAAESVSLSKRGLVRRLLCSSEQTPHMVADAHPARELTKSLNILRRDKQPTFFRGNLGET